ncbi:MAG: putative flap endonuclease-1-like 5' DNA nuclease [Flavobacterium sp.]|jgi:predicted flap endonuclease-1-like 5' DNA nuclease
MESSCLIIAITLGLICGIVGYFIAKSSQKSFKKEEHNYKSDLDACNQRNSQLETDLDTLRNQAKKPVIEKATFVSKTTKAATTSVIAFNAGAAKAVFGKKIIEDDLKLVEGIGPKIEELFKTSGILTWKRLSETSVDRCNKILHKAGERYKIHDPGTWPRQSKLAYQSKWQKLKDWQDKLDKGKEK